jgi:DNA polymerase
MAQALSHGLPGSLDSLCTILGVGQDLAKIKDGHRLVLKFCKPHKKRDGTYFWNTPETDPEDWAKYKEYCKFDVIAMREIYRKLPKWNYPGNKRELELWYLDQKTNSRGMYIDIPLVTKAMDAIASTQKDLAASTQEMTDGEVQAASQRDAMIKFIAESFGFYLPDMQKATLERIVESDDTPQALRELLTVRLSTCTTSTSKYKALYKRTSADSRLRGTIQFSGAQRTQRDAGRNGFQPQNLPRPVLDHELIMDGIDALNADAAELCGYDIMKLTSSATRYMVTAPTGKKLIIADLANIEGRVLAYLAGETWKIQAFRDYDTILGYDEKGEAIRKGPDLYVSAYARAFGIKPEAVSKKQRAVGKVLELSMGYAGGCGAFIAMAPAYHVDLEELAEMVLPALPADILKEADSFYEWINKFDVDAAKAKSRKDGKPWEEHYSPKRTFGLKKETHMALESLKRLWRREHPNVVQFWANAEAAFRNAIANPGKDFEFNKCVARRSGSWVRLILPSGHNLCYPSARVVYSKKEMKQAQGLSPASKDDENTEEVSSKGQIIFKGVNQFTKKWGVIKTFGGKAVENIVQGFARDIFKHGSLEAEKAGYLIVLPVHDENVTEVDDSDEFTVEELERIMATPPPWAPDTPLAAKGFTDKRYHKDLD